MDSPDGDQSGFVIDEVPSGCGTRYTWCLLDRHGDVLARAPQAYDTPEEAQVAIAEVIIGARENEVPDTTDQLIPANA